uniref:Ovule protein n=1 Tax=Panagrolaimus sp. ES5 TaxID=591445 RepID=A0AC34FMX9_9BILA
MELDSTQTMPVKSSSQQLQVTQQLQPTMKQISQPLHTAKLKKSVKSNRVSKLSSNFEQQHFPSKSQSRQKVVTLSMDQNAKPQNKKNPKGTKNKTEKKDSYGTISATGHSKKVNQIKTASTLDQY